MTKECPWCLKEVDMMIGRHKEVVIGVANGDDWKDIMVRVEAELCPECGGISIWKG